MPRGRKPKIRPLIDPFLDNEFGEKARELSDLIAEYNQLFLEGVSLSIGISTLIDDHPLREDVGGQEIISAYRTYLRQLIREAIADLGEDGIININIPGL